jgi:hypothetical protein
MNFRVLVGSLFLLLIANATASYADGCGDMTLCVKNPPFPPNPPSCTQYPNFCSNVPPQTQAAAPPEASSGPGYSITLENLSKEQLNKILQQLEVDTSRIKAPQ